MAGPAPRTKPAAVPSAPASLVRRAPQAELIKLLCADALPRGWGERIGLFGAPRTGKSFFSNRLLEYIADRVDVVVVHYPKEEPEKHFPSGAVRVDFADVVAKPPTDTNIIVFNDRDLARIPKPVTLASWAMHQAREHRRKIAIVIDEIFYAQSGRQAWDGGALGPTAEAIRVGGSLGITFIGGSQVPQTMPTEMFDCPENTVLFALEGRSLEYFDYQRDMLDATERLARGECVVKQRGQPWNRTIYGPG
ncbi:MAG TPA: hypothetical protein VJV75_03805 [Candidatus Polarisedimenticolia bacterium]|nr:hypothetical protein [Candidatus Polarisedimenticolia bacterium]